MNLLPLRRALLLFLLLTWIYAEPGALAQPRAESELSGAVLGWVFTTRDLVISNRDLMSSNRDLVFPDRDLVLTIQDTGGAVKALAMKENDTEVRLELAADVLFDFDKADILPKAHEALHQVALVIRQRKTGRVRIEGHTDAKGSDAYNRSLSERRAKAVLDWLMAKENLKQLKAVRFSSAGFGKTRPVAPNTRPDGADDPDGRQKNRRVEIVVRKG